MDHRIEVVDYDPSWPEAFERERAALEESLQPWAAGPIAHIGSTAVPGLCAKPVIDILVPVHGLVESRPAIAVLEERHGYGYWPYKSEEMHWLCKPSEHVRTHHVHMVPVGSVEAREKLGLRDLLRRDDGLRERYGVLKRELARLHPDDREAYTLAKAPFIRELIRTLRG